MLSLEELLDLTINKGASDLHLTVGVPPIIRVDGNLVKVSEEIFLNKQATNQSIQIQANNDPLESLRKQEIFDIFNR